MTRRTHRWVMASLAIATAIAITGCQGGSDTADPQPGAAQPAAASPSASTPSTSTPAQPADRPSRSTATPGTDFGFIRSWHAKTGSIYLRFDRAVLLTGKAADDAAAAAGDESPVPNDIYIQNDNPRLREVAIVDQATVLGSQQLTGSPGPNRSNLKALLTFLTDGGSRAAATPFQLTYNDNGLVVQVQKQYVP